MFHITDNSRNFGLTFSDNLSGLLYELFYSAMYFDCQWHIDLFSEGDLCTKLKHFFSETETFKVQLLLALKEKYNKSILAKRYGE